MIIIRRWQTSLSELHRCTFYEYVLYSSQAVPVSVNLKVEVLNFESVRKNFENCVKMVNMWMKFIYCVWSRQGSRKVVLIYGSHVLQNFTNRGFIVLASNRFQYTKSYGQLRLECLSITCIFMTLERYTQLWTLLYES